MYHYRVGKITISKMTNNILRRELLINHSFINSLHFSFFQVIINFFYISVQNIVAVMAHCHQIIRVK